MEIIIIAALVGLLAGAGTAPGVAVSVGNNRNKIVEEASSKAASDAVKGIVEGLNKPSSNLTEPDLLKVACSAEHIEVSGDLLCREMFCRMQTRGIDTKTSGLECEAISNVSNKRVMMKSCDELDELKRKDCYAFFDKRI